MTWWGDVAARARGLGTGLLRGDALQALDEAADLVALRTILEQADPCLPVAIEPTAHVLDAWLAERVTRRMRILERWFGDDAALLTVIFEDEDRRSLRALIRGAIAHAPPEQRLAATVPTRALPARALGELAHAPSLGAMTALLRAWRSPYAEPLSQAKPAAEPSALALEVAVNATFARRALAAARRGGRPLVAYVREVIDLENGWSALILAAQGGTDAEPCFVGGGQRIDRAAFAAAAAATSAEAAAGMLAQTLAGTPLARVFDLPMDPSALEQRALEAQLDAQVRAARRDPLGAAPVLVFALRSRAETTRLRRAIWRAALGSREGSQGARAS